MMVDNDEEQHKGHNVNKNTSSWNQISSFGLLNLERARQLIRSLGYTADASLGSAVLILHVMESTENQTDERHHWQRTIRHEQTIAQHVEATKN